MSEPPGGTGESPCERAAPGRTERRSRTASASRAALCALGLALAACGGSSGGADASRSAPFTPNPPEVAGSFAYAVQELPFDAEPYGPYRARLRLPTVPAGGTVPVVLISTGIGSVGEDASWWAEHLASHGYATVTFTPPNPDQWDLNQWVVGYRGALTALEEATAERGSPLAAAVDPGRAALLGTSFGGTAVIEVTGTDPRVRAAIALAPGINDLVPDFFQGALDAAPAIRVPIQLHMGSEDCILNPRPDTLLGFTVGAGRAVLTYFDRIPGPRQYVEIEGGNHTGYRNLPEPGAPDFYSDINLDCPRRITPEEQHRLAARYVTMFLDRALYRTDTWDDALFGTGIARDLEQGELSAHLEAGLEQWTLP